MIVTVPYVLYQLTVMCPTQKALRLGSTVIGKGDTLVWVLSIHLNCDGSVFKLTSLIDSMDSFFLSSATSPAHRQLQAETHPSVEILADVAVPESRRTSMRFCTAACFDPAPATSIATWRHFSPWQPFLGYLLVHAHAHALYDDLVPALFACLSAICADRLA